MLGVRHGRFWLVIGWLLIIVAFVVCLLPGKDLPEVQLSDKYEHTILYLILTLWFTGLYPRSRYAVIATALFVMGVTIEIAQGAMHLGRTADVHDVMANTAGILIGLMLALAGLGGWAQWIDGWTRGRAPAPID
ncbi:MAG TPA: VanZ family protein [Povalibacter sp.]|nr:VanZ family protein [Povalibacter sp.]